MSVHRFRWNGVQDKLLQQQITGMVIGAPAIRPEIDITLADDTLLDDLKIAMNEQDYSFVASSPVGPPLGTVTILEGLGQAAQSAAPAGSGRIYFDTATGLWLLNQNTAEASQYWPLQPDLAHGSQEYDDFESSDVQSQLEWTTVTSGTGAAVSVVSTNIDANHFGMRELNTGTTTTGRAGFYLSLGLRVLGGSKSYIETLIRVPTLSVAAQRYAIRLGFGDIWNVATLSPMQGVYFEYDEAMSLNWRAVNQNAAAVSAVDSGVAVVAGAFIKLGIFVTDSPAGSTFFIDGVQVAGTPIATNLPTTFTGRGYRILKSVGTTARTMLVDYFLQRTRFTVAR